ncbi:MAG: hypothetical protein R8G66_21295 [Cytophagales bacterium]|nr:hypothetical protein [Cytophagales bacterium]
MRTSSTYKKRSRPINRTGSPFGNGRGIAGPKALHLFRLEDQVNQSDRVRHGKLLQQKAYLFTTQLKKNGQDESPNHQVGKYIPSKGAEIHVYESPHGNKKIKGQLSVGQTTYLINSHHKALKALELLRQHREAKGFS